MSKTSRAQELIGIGNRLFDKKWQLDNLYQEMAWQFCPDLADFVTPIVLGDDWAADRMDGFPEQVSRELSNQLGAMLRPQDRPWFRTTTLDDDLDADEENARALQYITQTIRRNLYNPKSKFIRATKEADRFYVNFGMAVLSIEEAPQTRDHLFFRNHHLKNCAWLENNLGDVDNLHRRDKMTARVMLKSFQESKIDRLVKEAAEKEPTKEFPIQVIVMPSDEYDMVKSYADDSDDSGRKKKLPYVIVYIDVEHERILKESGLPEFIYVVPRWWRLPDSQYAFSPAAMAGLADARMAQMLSQIILEAGEKAVDPPIMAKQEIIIGEPNIMAGGISWVDAEYDQKVSDAMETLHLNPDLRVGFEMRRDLREMLSRAFYIDKLNLPETKGRTTAFEVARKLEEHVRNLLPLFEPMQIEYNTRLLDKSFTLLRNMGKFDWARLPPDLLGTDITWAFESPIQEAQDRVLVEQFKASLEVLAMGLQAGAHTQPLHLEKALRDAIRGVGGPAVWRKTVEEQQQETAKIMEEKMLQKAMAEASQVAGIAGQAGDAANKLGFQPSADKMAALQAKQGNGAASPEGGEDQVPAAPEEQMGSPVPAGGATPLQRSSASIDDLMMMQRRLLAAVTDLSQSIRRPKNIKIKRGKDGKIESATASHGE